MGKHETNTGKKADDHKAVTDSLKEGHQNGGHKGSSSKPQGAIHCVSKGCKSDAKRFDFCNEHYDQFKFGLIRKTGEPALDYEKKFEHYTAFKKKQRVPKAA